jgi:hypothetical protein
MKMCPQEYAGSEMRAVKCTKCTSGWSKSQRACIVPTGAEHLPLVRAENVPSCPMQALCQHQVQTAEPCAVRARGMICQSALKWAGMSEEESLDHPLAFHASYVVD